jgi:selenide,water dikinase
VLVGFDTSDDAGVYRLSDELCLIQTADFITPIGDDPYLFGQVAAANALSDIYAMGGKPVSAINLCCFPPQGIEKKYLTEILQGGLDMLEKAGASLLGGHTIKDNELKYGLSVNGIANVKDIKRNSSARPGDKLILTKPIGTGVVIQAIKQKVTPESSLSTIAESMSALNEAACRLMLKHNASACTDISGFGLAGHGWEMAKGSGLGIRINARAIPHFPLSLELLKKDVKIGMNDAIRDYVGKNISVGKNVSKEYEALLFDPQTSGGLLISIPSGGADALLADLHQSGVNQAKIIGEVFQSAPGLEITSN